MSVRDAIEHAGFDEFVAALDPDVLWIGIHPGELCRGRDEVVGTFRRALESGHTGNPEVLHADDSLIVVDPHVEPPLRYPELHQIFVLRDGRIVEMRDYPNRASALAALDFP